MRAVTPGGPRVLRHLEKLTPGCTITTAEAALTARSTPAIRTEHGAATTDLPRTRGPLPLGRQRPARSLADIMGQGLLPHAMAGSSFVSAAAGGPP